MPYITKYKFRLIGGFFINLFFIGLSILNPYLAGLVILNVIEGGQHELLLPYLAIMIANTVFRSVVRYTVMINMESISQNVLFELRQDLYHKLHIQNYSWFDKNRVGDIMSRMTGDLEAIRHFVAFDLINIPDGILLYTLAIVAMATVNVPLTLAMILVTPIVIFTALRQSKEVRPAFHNVRERFSKLNSVCTENIGGNRVVKAFTKEAHEIEKFTEANEAFFDSNMGTAKIQAKYIPIMEACANALPFILLLLGSLLVIWEYIELWELVMVSGYIWMLNHPTRMFGWHVNSAQNFATSLDKVYGMMRGKVYIQNPENPVRVDEIKGAVEFRNVNFRYGRNETEPYVLKDISFRAEKGQTVGIVGGTGSGKTTLIQLISRFHDATTGEVLVDAINVKEYHLSDLRQGIAYAMQDVFLYSDTVEGNIAYGVPDASMESIFSAAAVADADGFVQHMSEGYDTVVGERGVGLSGGQKQRLSLARAIAVEPSILVLDDVTSAVDMETEHRIQAALAEKVLKSGMGRTTFIVAHRLSSVKEADLILVMGDGAIIERGTHEELVELGGYYAQLYEEQRGGSYGAQHIPN